MIYLFSVFLCLWSFSSSGTAFLSGSEDIPLMLGMAVQESPAIFDKKEGQVLVSKAITHETTPAILRFYDQVLPNLGWTKLGMDTYRRKTQTLKIKIEKKENGQHVTFNLVEVNESLEKK